MEYRITAFLLVSVGLHVAVMVSWWQAPQGQRWAGTSLNVSLASHNETVSPAALSPNVQRPGEKNRTEHTVNKQKVSSKTTIEKTATTKQPLVRPARNKQARKNIDIARSVKTQSSSNNQAATGSLLKAGLWTLLSANFNYPPLARRNNWEGNLEVSLRVEADGRLSHITLVQSSGYPVLDHAAISNLQKIAAIPQARNWLEGNYFDMVLPIKYQLIDG